jgi:hypothetical protein
VPAGGDGGTLQRRDSLARAAAAGMESALAFLGMIDPEAFDIALAAAAPPAGETPEDAEIPENAEIPEDAETSEDAETPEDEEPLPVCRQCGAPVGIFLSHGVLTELPRRRRHRAAVSGCGFA